MRDLLIPLVLVAAGLAAYHVFVADAASTEGGGSSPDLEARVAHLEREGGGSAPVLSGSALEKRLAAIEARLDALAAARPDAGAPAPRDEDRAWDDRQLDRLEAAMRAVRERGLRARQEKQYDAMIARVAPALSAQRRAEVLGLVMAFLDDVRRLYPDGSAGATPEERDETARRLAALRADLERDLRALLADDVATKVLGGVPGAAPLGPGMRTPPRPPAGDGK